MSATRRGNKLIDRNVLQLKLGSEAIRLTSQPPRRAATADSGVGQ